MLRAVLLLSTIVSLGGTGAMAAPMGTDEIREAVTGRRIYLQVPLGGEFPLFYQEGGRVDGSGQARGLGVAARVNDTGRWWVADNRLCQRWTKYEDGRQFCFVLERTGGDRLRWTRSDGMTGDARIGR